MTTNRTPTELNQAANRAEITGGTEKGFTAAWKLHIVDSVESDGSFDARRQSSPLLL